MCSQGIKSSIDGQSQLIKKAKKAQYVFHTQQQPKLTNSLGVGLE